MKKLILSAIAAASVWCAGGAEVDLRNFEITSTNDVAAIASIPEWNRGVDTNGVTISVCVGMASRSQGMLCTQLPLFRDLKFDSEGRLLQISKVDSKPTSSTVLSSGKPRSFLDMASPMAPSRK